VRCLLVVEAHHAVAALVHLFGVSVVFIPRGGMQPLLPGVAAG